MQPTDGAEKKLAKDIDEKALSFLLTLPMGHKIGHGRIELEYHGDSHKNELACFTSHLRKMLREVYEWGRNDGIRARTPGATT